MGIPPIGAVGTENSRVFYMRSVRGASASQNAAPTEQNNAVQQESTRRRYDSVDFSSNEAPQDFKAIALIKGSEISPPEPQEISNADQAAELTSRIREASRGTEAVQTRTRGAVQAEENETVSTSETANANERSNPFRLTPAQRQGVEQYQRVQNYINPLNVSMARAAG